MKPTLYIHCGIHKTGSSFLQTMFVRNRDLLGSRGIHYPKSEKEFEMLNGEITPGNGIHLAKALIQKEKVVELLIHDLAELRRMGLHSLLYSSETLFHAFAQNGAVSDFCSAAEDAGFDKIKALVYFRDPVSHILSTYKHRAKNGDHPDFKAWLHSNYETFDLIKAFLGYRNKYPIDWSCRKYSQESKHMIQSSFADWLSTDLPDIPEDDRVNRSLKLSEIRILQELKNDFQGSEVFIREALLSVDSSHKESDRSISAELSKLAAEYLKEKENLFKELNKFLRKDENLLINSGKVHNPPKKDVGISLSLSQMRAVAQGMKKYSDSQQPVNKIKDYWTRGVRKVKRKWVASRLNTSPVK